MLSILIREHSVCLQLFWSLFIPFINHHFEILSIQVHVCFFGAVINGITFLILIFPCVSSVYRNKVDSCMFILYPVIDPSIFPSLLYEMGRKKKISRAVHKTCRNKSPQLGLSHGLGTTGKVGHVLPSSVEV